MQQTAIQQRRTNLLKKIQKLFALQHKFMPNLDSYLASQSSCVLDPASMSTPEHIPLYFPSSFPPELRSSICTGCYALCRVQSIDLFFVQQRRSVSKSSCRSATNEFDLSCPTSRSSCFLSRVVDRPRMNSTCPSPSFS